MNEDKFNEKVKVNLDHSVDSLDFATRQQLAERRRLALDKFALNSQQANSWLSAQYWREYWMPASAFALCALAAVLVVINPQQSGPAVGLASNNADNPAAVLEVLNSDEDLDVISDPDFYAWAEETLNADKTPNHKDSADAV